MIARLSCYSKHAPPAASCNPVRKGNHLPRRTVSSRLLKRALAVLQWSWTTSGTPVEPKWRSVDQQLLTRCTSIRRRPTASVSDKSWSENLRRKIGDGYLFSLQESHQVPGVEVKKGARPRFCD